MGIYRNLELEISEAGAEFIAGWEGVELEAYQDVKGIWTIGVGHIEGVQPGDTLTYDEAIALFQKDVTEYVDAVNEVLSVPLSQRQMDSLVSLCFNIGIHGFSTSTLARKLNRREYRSAADEFVRWNKVTDQGRLREVKGLTNRRLDEARMFRQGTYQRAGR